ncbi:nitroreductase family protein [Sphingobium sp. B2]|uniref:nitroreductase family protein n=1 Tax=Sphingobium sp. B2 TaxID=2583228 RepID=UPI0016438EFA|nr:nitroreductase family protein [Sphingobium sp. B2]
MSAFRTFKIRAKALVPEAPKRWFRTMRDMLKCGQGWLYDARRYARYSGTLLKNDVPSAMKADVTKYYHMIEKGLALPQPRPGFGQHAILDLSKKMQRAFDRNVLDQEMQFAVDALAGYQQFNERVGVASAPFVGSTLDAAKARGLSPRAEPTLARERPVGVDAQDMLAMIRSRHSVRQFADAPVPDEVLQQAAMAAQAAPCVCNRQASKVYFVRDPALKARLLACQNGNRGFGDTAPVLAIVTVDLHEFLEPSERYQPWIDGGLFAMNLLLGIHAQGYGACCLNWSALPAQDRSVRRIGLIPDNENVVMMMAIGALPDAFSVARSGRKPLAEVMRIV